MGDETISIHGNEWERSYIRDSVEQARQASWAAAHCVVSAEHHQHCSVCWWELHQSSDPARVGGYRASDAWLCEECHRRFIAGDEFGLARCEADKQAEMSVQQRLFERLERAAPELRSLRSEHEADHNGELLGHLLMSDILRWACAALDSQPDAVDAVLEEMARSLQPGDDPVSNMISVSFLENLGEGDSRELAIRARLPGKLREELERMRSWRPGSADLPLNE